MLKHNQIQQYKIIERRMRMLQYKGFLVDDNLNIYSARTGMQLTPTKGSDGYMQVQYRIVIKPIIICQI